MLRKCLSIIFVLILLILPMFAPNASGKTIDELKQEKEKLTQQIAQKNQELASIKDEVEQQRELLRQYDEQRTAIEQLIEITKELIDIIKLDLTETQEKLDAKERECKESYVTLGQRLRYLHMNDSTSTISLILGADSFADALTIGQYMSKVSENDIRLIEELNEIIDEIETMRNRINRDLSDQESLMEENVRSRERLAELIQKADSDLSYAQAKKAATQAEIDELIAAEEAAQAEINEKMAGYSSEPYVGGVFRWPVPGFFNISSGYGWRTLYGVQNFHAGIDIAGSGIYGAGVVASNVGVVHTVVYSSVGYGNYIIMDHGGGYMTLYGHLSAIYVVEGENRDSGDVIGAVGSTGNSTGPHLHFELRLKGEKLDPINEGGLLRY